MKLVFELDGVICTPPEGIQFGIVEYVKHSKPIANVIVGLMRSESHTTSNEVLETVNPTCSKFNRRTP